MYNMYIMSNIYNDAEYAFFALDLPAVGWHWQGVKYVFSIFTYLEFFFI